MKKKNPTTQVVRAAMKAVSKDVRAPKAVRDKIVKPAKKKKPTPSIVAYAVPKKPIKVLGAKLNDIKFKQEDINHISTITQSFQTHVTWDESFPIEHDFETKEYKFKEVISRQEFGDVTLNVKVKPKKIKKMKKLLDEFVYGNISKYVTLDILIEGEENFSIRYSMTGYLTQINLPIEEDACIVTFSPVNMICAKIWN